jgi:hypothetical protein
MELYKGYTINIVPDESPESPRKWDNLGTMVCFNKRYDLGDKHDFKSSDYNNWKEIEKAIEEKEGDIIIFPLYLYDHSGLHIKIGSFKGLLPQGHAEFDSGQVGFIYCSRKKACKEFGKKRVSKSMIAKVAELLKQEVDMYGMYLAGGIVGFTVKDSKGEVIDSCWGYYEDNQALQDAKGTVDHLIKKALEAKVSKLKAFIRHHVPLEARYNIGNIFNGNI